MTKPRVKKEKQVVAKEDVGSVEEVLGAAVAEEKSIVGEVEPEVTPEPSMEIAPEPEETQELGPVEPEPNSQELQEISPVKKLEIIVTELEKVDVELSMKFYDTGSSMPRYLNGLHKTIQQLRIDIHLIRENS